jgi:hypothetical protein
MNLSVVQQIAPADGANYTDLGDETKLGPIFGCPLVLPGETVTGWHTFQISSTRTPALLIWDEIGDAAAVGDWDL